MKALSPFVIAFAVSGALAGPAFSQVADSVLAISQGGTSILRVNEDAGMVVRGDVGVGSIPATGGGVRMMWYPGLYSLRAGQVNDNQWDVSNIGAGSVAFGYNTIASGDYSLALGDESRATGEAAVALGSGAEATSDHAVAIGISSVASSSGSIALGPSSASGSFATSIGYLNSASGVFSVAIGTTASTANRTGAIVISDASSTTPADSVYATADNQFVVRGTGGVIFYTTADMTVGAQLLPGSGAWSTLSDRNRKMNFAELDGENVLLSLRNVPVTTWNYTSQDETVRHAGAMAQDFHAAFGLGESNLLINTVDMDGITLAAVKALETRSAAQSTRILELEGEISVLNADRAALLERLQSLEERQARLEALLDGDLASGERR